MSSKYASMLTQGALAKLQRNEDVLKPILQVLELKKVKDSRLRVYLWDGVEQFNYGMVSSQAIPPVEARLKPLCLIQINNSCLSVTKEKPILIMMDIDVVADADDVGEQLKVTEPAAKRVLADSGNSSSSAALPHTPAKVGRMFGSNDVKSSPGRSNLVSIGALNPYNQTRSLVRGRVTSKGDMKTWSKATGSGKLFSFEIMDESGEIRVTAFNEQADKFYDLLKVKEVYYFSGFQCKPANPNFRSNNNEYELTLGKFSNVEYCTDVPTDSLPDQTFNFTKIATIETLPLDQLVDVCGVIKSVGDSQTFNRKADGKPLTKREVQLVDDSDRMITLTVWNDACSRMDNVEHPVVVLTKARLSSFNGSLTISAAQTSTLELDPALDRVSELRNWWNTQGQSQNFESIRGSGPVSEFTQQWMDLDLITKKGENLGMEKPIYVWDRVTITSFNSDNALYKACATENCMKKVQADSNGLYQCEKCGNDPQQNFKWRILLRMVVSDATKESWCTAFNEKAEQILGVTANTLGTCSEEDPDKMQRIFAGSLFKEFHMKFRGKIDSFQDERRFQLSVVEAKEVKLVDDCKHLISQINDLSKFL